VEVVGGDGGVGVRIHDHSEVAIVAAFLCGWDVGGVAIDVA
jgi:hypothetical protein